MAGVFECAPDEGFDVFHGSVPMQTVAEVEDVPRVTALSDAGPGRFGDLFGRSRPHEPVVDVPLETELREERPGGTYRDPGSETQNR